MAMAARRPRRPQRSECARRCGRLSGGGWPRGRWTRRTRRCVRSEGGWRSPGKVVGGRGAASSGSRWSGGGHRGSGWCGGAGGRQRAPAQMAAGRQQQRLREGLQSQENGEKRKGVSLALRHLAKQRPQYRHTKKRIDASLLPSGREANPLTRASRACCRRHLPACDGQAPVPPRRASTRPLSTSQPPAITMPHTPGQQSPRCG